MNASIDESKKSIMLFPGVTKAFKEKTAAINFLNNKLASDSKQLFRIVFCVNTTGDQIPVDTKKLIGEDNEMKNVQLCDALFQRLTAQV